VAVLCANVVGSRDRSGSGRASRSKKDKRQKERPSKYGDEEVEALPSGGYYEDDAGVKVHTVPGKPSTIEVEYTGGPIIVSVDTQGDSLESVATEELSDSSTSSSSSSSSSGERRRSRHNRSMDALERKKKKKKKRKRKTKEREHEVQSADEVLEGRDKKKRKKRNKSATEEPIYENQPRKSKKGREEVRTGGKQARRKSEEEPLYANQSQILAEMRRLEEQRAMVEERERLEQERAEREAERERVDEAEAKRLRQEERDARKAKKLERRRQRQNIEEPEPPVFLEAKPSLTYPQEMWAEPDYDSDDVENEQHRVAENAKRRAIAAARSLIQRWSEAEDDHEPGDVPPGKFSPESGHPKPKKPPRPAVSPQRLEVDADLLPSAVTPEDSRMPNPVPRPRTNIPKSKVTEPDQKYETFVPETDNGIEAKEMSGTVPEAKIGTEAERMYETVLREVESTSKIELSTVAVLNSGSAKWVDSKLVEHYSDEALAISDDHSSGGLDVETAAAAEHRGLRMRVTGEMPKAYSRVEKDSARTAFMLAPPVGIETGSEEESDGGASSPLGTGGPTALWDCAPEYSGKMDDGMEPLPPGSGTSSKSTKLPFYAKPYTSFGKIEPRVDALEEALKEEGRKKVDAEPRVPVPNIKGEFEMADPDGKNNDDFKV